METTEVQEVSVIETALQKANVTDSVIAKLKADYLGLKINGLDDKEGFEKVETARKECKRLRVLATNICKSGREEAIKIQKDWIEKEKEVTGKISEVEDHLESESDRIKEEEKRILFEAAQRAKLPIRKDKLMTIGTEVADEELLKINDEQFNALFNDLHSKMLTEQAEKLKAEQAKIEAEKKETARIEAEKLAAEKRKKELEEAAAKARIEAEQSAKAEIERKEREAQEAVARAEREKIAAEVREKLAAEKAEADRVAALKKAETDKAEAIAKLKREQEEKEAAEIKAKQEAIAKAEAEEAARLEAELTKGDADKFADLIVALTALKTKYTFKSKKYQKLYSSTNELIDKIINWSVNK